MRSGLGGLALFLFLAACAARPPVAVLEAKGAYRDVATCVMADLQATERNMVFAEDASAAKASLWANHDGRGPEGRKFDLLFVQRAPGITGIEVLYAGATVFEEERFLARLREALAGCPR